MANTTKKWSQEAIQAEIERIQAELGITRMPTQNEIKRNTKSLGLIAAIYKSGGLIKWAENLNISTKDSEFLKAGSEIQDRYHQILQEKTGFEFEKAPFHYPFTFLHEDTGLTVLLKVKNRQYPDIHRTSHVYPFVFNVKQYPSYYMLACNNAKLLDKMLIVPGFVLHGRKYINIGGRDSKYNYFRDKYNPMIQDIKHITKTRRYMESYFDRKWDMEI